MNEVQRLVVKVGTLTITDKEGRIDRESAENIVAGVSEARGRGVDVALVSSGSIAAGMERLEMESRPGDMDGLQAAAAVGQGLLVHLYAEMFSEKGIISGQVLLTRYDMMKRQHYTNARHTLDRLFKTGVVPIINENDTVATDEISFGDNDMLAALVASLVRADLLVLLTNTGGLYTADPEQCADARLIEKVDKITPEIERLCGGSGSDKSTGGMFSKIQAAKAATSAGVDVIIADGRIEGLIPDLLGGSRCGTCFPASGRMRSKKHWIGFATQASGRLVIDSGAVGALLEQNRSLLPAGVLGVEGDFQAGDTVDILDERGRVVARGIANYGAEEAEKIKGLRSGQIQQVFGEKGEVMVHRDLLVVLMKP